MMSKDRSRGLQLGLVCSMVISVFSLAGCGGGGGGGGDGGSGAAQVAAPVVSTPAAPAPTTTPPATDPPVAPPSTLGTASLAWTPPTEKEDGSTLADLTGYRVYAGRARDALELVASLDNPGLSRHVLENLAAGTWYFTITAVARDGAESVPSNLAQKVVR